MSAAFAARQRAAEGHWFALEDRLNQMKRLERLVDAGKVEAAVLEAARAAAAAAAPARRGRDTPVWEYRAGVSPPPPPRASAAARFGTLGTRMSMGRARWAPTDASVFSVADGRRLASAPAPALDHYQNLRAAKIAAAAADTPVVLGGLRVLPAMTPGRAFAWGSVLAVWGVAALVAGSARSLGIRSPDEAAGALREALAPARPALQRWLGPAFAGAAARAAAGGAAAAAGGAESPLVAGLRATLFAK